MKKILSFLLVVILLCSIPAAAFADNFVGKTANAGTPELEKAEQLDGTDSSAQVAFTPYKERDGLPDARRSMLDEAYESLRKASPLAGLNTKLEDAARRDLAVSDLFDIGAAGEEAPGFPMKITVKDKNLGKFVALLRFADGEWQWVDAKTEGDSLSFTVESFSPYAVIVVANKFAPARSSGRIPYGTILGVLFLGAAAVCFSLESRKGRRRAPRHVKGA